MMLRAHEGLGIIIYTETSDNYIMLLLIDFHTEIFLSTNINQTTTDLRYVSMITSMKTV